jgi:hypothetical protein
MKPTLMLADWAGIVMDRILTSGVHCSFVKYKMWLELRRNTVLC